MSEDKEDPTDPTYAETEVERFQRDLGPFVVAVQKTRMPMVFTDAGDSENPIVFANESFLTLTKFGLHELLGVSFMTLMTRGAGSDARGEIEAAFAGTQDSEPEICYRRRDDSTFWASVFISPVWDDAGRVTHHFISLVDTTRQREKQADSEMLIDELNHRVKNTLSTVQSIVGQSLRASNDPQVIADLIESRIFALSRSHDLLTDHNWEGAKLHELIEAALKPFEGETGRERFRIDGDDARLLPKATLALGIALHELATNAVKYGALSADRGKVLISSDIKSDGQGDRLNLTWRETDGPVVAPPEHKGFGSQILERGLALELRGHVALDYSATGLVCTIDFPISGRTAHA